MSFSSEKEVRTRIYCLFISGARAREQYTFQARISSHLIASELPIACGRSHMLLSIKPAYMGLLSNLKKVAFGYSAILDARLALEMPHGSPVTCGFATEEELQRWPKLKVPNVQQRHQMASVSSDMIGVHFE
ncbi:hypothetical protein F5Y08DRAFT_28393 [Xylaria arbuscula]|nr:hypothetical protein F5Y08DRAFT_28393 [Xylaria arbuscula]